MDTDSSFWREDETTSAMEPPTELEFKAEEITNLRALKAAVRNNEFERDKKRWGVSARTRRLQEPDPNQKTKGVR